MPEKYSLGKAWEEAQKMKEITGEKASKEDYDVAEQLVEEEDKKLRKKFEKMVRDNFDLIPSWDLDREALCFKSDIKGVDNITISRPNKDANFLAATLIYEKKNKEGERIYKTGTMTIGHDGDFVTDFQPDLMNLINNKTKVYKEILDDLESMGFGKMTWLNISESIIPPGENNKPRGEQKRERKERALIDRKRLYFFTKNPDCLAGVSPEEAERIIYGSGGKYGPGQEVRSGRIHLSEYHSFVFPKGVVFENCVRENRIFFYKFKDLIHEEMCGRLKNNELTEEEKIDFINSIGLPQEIIKTKKELQKEGKEYHPIHMPHNKEERKKRFYERLERDLLSQLI